MESRWISRLQIPNPCNNLLGLHLEWNTTSDVRLLVSNLDHSCIITRGRKWRKSLITRVSKKSALQRDGEIHRKIGWSSGVEDETLQNKIDVLSFRFTIIPENRVEPRGRFSWTRKCSNPVARILVAGLSFPDTFLVFVSECRATVWAYAPLPIVCQIFCAPFASQVMDKKRIEYGLRRGWSCEWQFTFLFIFKCFTTGTCRLSVEYELSFAICW